MTWKETEELVDKCINLKLDQRVLINIAYNLAIYDSCNFVIIMKEKGIIIPV